MILLVYCLVITPTNKLLNSCRKWGSSKSILSTLSDSEITSGRINLKSDERYKRKAEWYNTWINGSSACRKVLKLSNIEITDWTNIESSYLAGCLNAFANLFSLLGFSSGSLSVWSSSKSKLNRRYDSKESYYISILSKHFPGLNHFVGAYFTNFVIVNVHELP